MEIRSFSDIGTPKVLEGRVVEGYAIVFNKESRVIYDNDKKLAFTEIIERGAVTAELISRCDIKAVLEHDKSRLLARCRYGTGSLNLSIDDYGLKYSFIAPNTVDGDFLIEMVLRGDLYGSSFNYRVNEKDKEKVSYSKKDGLTLRTVHKIDWLSDVSPVSDPAFCGTSVTVRSLAEMEEEALPVNDYLKHINELKKLI